ncbi:hypothetical protein KUL10_25270 [Glaciecola sp. KUL10]|nr:hypothetical protein KUL10_25270 [Glaciecola sp. KUL10]
MEGGKKGVHTETIVLLHGIFARKEHWVDLARELTPYFRVIALDLPGFGDNKQLGFEHYLLSHQKQNLLIVLDALEIESAHFGANSMGAAVAALMAATRPDLLRSLTFIGSPLGVDSLIQSDMQVAIANGQYPLLVESEKEFEIRNQWLFPKTPAIPSPILRTWMKQELKTVDHNKQIWLAANSFVSTPKLLDLAPTLELPTLILWCQEDRIFHVSGADLLHEALPNSQREILNNSGHIPMLDKPKQIADLYLDFLLRP